MSSSPVSVQNSKLTVVSVTPRADTRAPANTNIVITFSEDIVKGSGSIVIRNWNYQIILDESIDSPLFTIAGKTLTLNPSLDFDFVSSYTIYISAGLVKSLSGTPLSIESYQTFQFHTDYSQTAINFDGNDNSETIYGSTQQDTINGGGGGDRIYGHTGDDILNGGDESSDWDGDSIEGGAGNDTIHGNNGRDYLTGGIGNDTIYGDDGQDNLYGNEGDDALDGGNGNDRLSDEYGNNTLVGGAGDDYLSSTNYDNSTFNVLDGGSGNDTFYVNGIVQIKAGDGDDKIEHQGGTRVDKSSTLDGGEGNDQFEIRLGSGEANIVATGGGGKDTFYLRDIYSSSESKLAITDFTTGSGGDQIDLKYFTNYYSGQSLNPFADGGVLRLRQDGADTLLKRVVSGSELTIARLEKVLLANLTAANFVGGIDPKGSSTGLTITGTDNADTITGDLMNDKLSGLSGPDILRGENGDDILIGGDESASNDNDQLYGGYGNDLLQGGAGDDTLDGGYGDDTLQGGSGNDTINDYSGNNVISGGSGNDKIDIATSGTINGDEGNDEFTINVYDANALIRISGGAGKDLFRVTSSNSDKTVITDFSAADGDQIDLSQSLYTYSNDPSGNPFGTKGFLRAEQVNNDVIISVDTDGAAGNAQSLRQVLRLENTTLTKLSGLNFVGGWNPNGSDDGVTITGTAGNDRINGQGLNDKLYGGDGSDTIYGYGGNDLIEGGDENRLATGDFLYGGLGDDTILGNKGNDTLDGEAGADKLDGGEGDDQLDGGEGNDILNGGDGNDRLSDSSGQNTLNGGEGNDTIFSVAGSVINGDNGDDKIEVGSNYYQVQTGASMVNAGAGNDEILIRSSSSKFTVDATGGTGRDTFIFAGTDFNASIVIRDFQTGNDGDAIGLFDLLPWNFNEGNPFGSSGYFRLVQVGENAVVEYDRDGAAKSAYGFLPLVTFNNVATSALTKNNFLRLINPNGSQDGLDLVGTDGADILNGDFLNDKLQGGAGNDSLHGGVSGDDTLLGGAGNDLLIDSQGNDTLDGGEGDDVLSDSGDFGNNTLLGGAGADSLSVNSIGSNQLNGGDGDDILRAGRGNDSLVGGNGNDIFIVTGSYFYSSTQNNTVTANGGDGKDSFSFSLNSSVTKFIATGGKGVDIFSTFDVVESDQYVVTDFQAGVGGDQIDVQRLLPHSLDGNNPFGRNGVLRLVQRGDDAILQTDTDGPLSPKQFQDVITLKGVKVADINATNFVNSYAPDGSNTDLKIEGGAAGEEFSGGNFNDTLSGNGGNDTISGGRGNDIINGGDGDDVLSDEFGFNTFNGGNGEDKIIAVGNNTNAGDGGDGNDTFIINVTNSVYDGGNGDDLFKMSNYGYYYDDQPGGLRVNGGSGNDTFSFISNYWSDSTINATGGEGRDIYSLNNSPTNRKFNVLDFDLNSRGDLISIAALFDKADSNPFDTGKLILSQNGSDTLIQYDADGALFVYNTLTLLTLKNVDKNKLTADHFAEHVNPLGGNTGVTIDGTSQSETIQGGWLNDTLTGLAGNDILFGLANKDILDGGAGNDVLEGGAGDDLLKGGEGFDQANYTNKFSSYTISKTSDGLSISDNSKADGADNVSGIEYLHFSDININLKMKEKAATIPAEKVKTLIEIYVAFFNRTPDADGLSYWIDQVKAGASISEISGVFYSIGASEQYAALTGFTTTMTNTDFINTFYKNVLGRIDGADAGGLAYWTNKLSTGASTRGSLAEDILNSAHTFKGDATYGYVADLLDNKYLVGKTLAIDWGITDNVNAYSRGVAIANAVTPTDISAALQLVGISANDMNFM